MMVEERKEGSEGGGGERGEREEREERGKRERRERREREERRWSRRTIIPSLSMQVLCTMKHIYSARYILKSSFLFDIFLLLFIF